MATTSKRRKRTPMSKPLPTIWEIPDDLWLRIKPILEKFWPRKLTGRRHATPITDSIDSSSISCSHNNLGRDFLEV